jgi:outer membrane protein OmpA-like peptidoglycan-associated protein
MLDSDGDGIVDARDAAPQAREDRDGFQDDDGAPDPDNDSDGVLDAADLCPGVAAGAGASVRGCPDGDGDGFVGAADLCPTVAPSPGEVARLSRGCAARPGEVYAREEVLASGARVTVIVLPVPVAFDAAGALTPAARAGIDAARTWLVVNPRAARVEVVAHTDDREAPAKERAARTQARADAVRTALLEGVPPLRVEPSRVSARGAGDSEPLRAGTSAAARAANRRVELRVLEEAPPGAGEP